MATPAYGVRWNSAPPIAIGSRRLADNPATHSPIASRSALSSTSASRLSLVDRKSTRLNSSHVSISYAVFCLKKKKLLEERLHVRQRLAAGCSRRRPRRELT